jgi:predicted RNA-binding Zn ribbon-like protein
MAQTTPFAPADVAAAGLVLAGEPLAVDLANTVKLATDPATELLTNDARHAAFWALQAHRLPPESAPPAPEQAFRLRAAVRSVLTSHLDRTAIDPHAVEVVNAFAAAAPSAPQLAVTGNDAERRTSWATSSGADLALAAVAQSAIDVVTGEAADRLRSCGSDACSMLFVATNAKRRWCSSAVCGNRERVARHARLAHQRREDHS